MIAPRLLSSIVLLALPLALGGCWETTWRHDSIVQVDVDDQPVTVSWINNRPPHIDLVVLAPVADLDGLTVKPDKLTVTVAEEAARRVAGHHCWFDDVYPEHPPLDFGNGQFAFRYRCGKP